MPSSYLNEHSAEFVLVPQFGNILALSYQQVTPIHFWSNREGGSISRKCMPNWPVQIAALFARRPKVSLPFQSFIEVKFNERLFSAAQFLEGKNIPVFAGVPLTSSLDDFHFSTRSLWFRLQSHGREEIIKISLSGELIEGSKSAIMLDATDIISAVENICKPMAWKEAIEHFRQLKNGIAVGYSRHSFWGDPYKPVYFLMTKQ
jgi:hypothetical protein